MVVRALAEGNALQTTARVGQVDKDIVWPGSIVSPATAAQSCSLGGTICMCGHVNSLLSYHVSVVCVDQLRDIEHLFPRWDACYHGR